MTVVVAGAFRVPPENVERFRPVMEKMLAASRAEEGCLDYSYAMDVCEPGLIRVFETWRDRAALDAHLRTGHLAEWRACWPPFGVSDRDLTLYEVAAQTPV